MFLFRTIFIKQSLLILHSKSYFCDMPDQGKLLHAIIENAIDGIITIDERGLIESLNPAACALFGYTIEEVLGSNISMLMPQPDRGQHDEYIAR